MKNIGGISATTTRISEKPSRQRENENTKRKTHQAGDGMKAKGIRRHGAMAAVASSDNNARGLISIWRYQHIKVKAIMTLGFLRGKHHGEVDVSSVSGPSCLTNRLAGRSWWRGSAHITPLCATPAPRACAQSTAHRS